MIRDCVYIYPGIVTIIYLRKECDNRGMVMLGDFF